MKIRVSRSLPIILILTTGLWGYNNANGSIYHQRVQQATALEPLTLEAVVEAEDIPIVTVSIYYRTRGQTAYQESPMSSAGGNLYFGSIPAGDVTTEGLEYYLAAVQEDGSVIGYPVDSPEQNPMAVSVRAAVAEAEVDPFEEPTTDLGEADVLILSPEPMQFVLPEEVVVGVSLFNVSDLDDTSIRLLIDGQDVTNQAAVSADLVTYSPATLASGAHQVEIHMNRTSGDAYEPVAWRFLVTETASVTTERAFRSSGTITPAYRHDNVDEQILDVTSLKATYRGGWDWLKMRANLKLTSEEDPNKAPRNRYTASFQTPIMTLGVGDVTPRFGRFGLDGKRIRGYDANLTLKLVNLRVAQGELERVIQGNPFEAYSAPGYSMTDSAGTDIHQLDLSRASYGFKRNILAVRPSFGTVQNVELAFTVIKTKDDVTSVNRLAEGDVDIPAELGAHPAFAGESWYGSTATHDTVITVNDTSISVIKRPLDINRLMELAEQYEDLYVNLPEKDWFGKTPQDNLVIGSSLAMSFNKRRFVLQSGFAFSMLNKNIWDPVLDKAALDTLAPGDNVIDGMVAGQVSLDALPDPGNFADYFHMNLNQIPLVPLATDSASLANPLRLITKMPSLAYFGSAKLNYLRNLLSFEFQQVGPQFNSLSNPNLQKDVRIRTISDRMRLFKNKLFLTAIYRTTDNDIVKVEDDPITKTKTVNLNANINLGFGLPSFTIGQRMYERNNGIDVPDTTIVPAQDIEGEEEIVIRDTRENSLTTARMFSLTYRLMLLESSHDLNLNVTSTTIEDLIEDRIESPTTVSPTATSSIINASVSSRLSDRLETNFIVGKNSTEIGGGATLVTQDIVNLEATARTIFMGGRLGVLGGIRLITNETNQDDNPLAPPSFTQFGVRGRVNYEIIDNLQFITEIRQRSKRVEIGGEQQTLPTTLFASRLEYTF